MQPASTLTPAKLAVICGAGVGLDTMLFRVPALLACLVLALCLLVLAARAYHSQRATPIRAFTRRFAAALLLLFYKPRPVDGPLFTFCYPNNA